MAMTTSTKKPRPLSILSKSPLRLTSLRVDEFRGTPMPSLSSKGDPYRRLRYGVLVVLTLSACVSGAPDLNDEQTHRLSQLTVCPLGGLPPRPYNMLGTVTAADCSGAPLGGRVYGNVDRAMDTLKRKAAAMNADSV